MEASLRNHFHILETFTQVYKEMSRRIISEPKKLILMKTIKSLNVMLADDDADDREFFTEALKNMAAQIKITAVKNGAELMKSITDPNTKLPDIIFLDLNMPCKNGKECLIEIKSDNRLKQIPVIIYSTSTHINDIESCFNHGADLYVAKPNTYNDLIKIAKKILAIDWNNFSCEHKIEKFILK